METISRVHAKALTAWGGEHPEAVVLSGDLTASCEADGFRDAYPDRFLSMGLAEQNMLGFAAGLAREGLRPHLHTFAVFMYRRALDQFEMSIAYPNLPVRVFGFLPGVTTPGGASHQAINDIAVLRSLPNMTILEAGDATDVESMLPLANSIDGPVYCRMLRGALPRIFPAEDKLVLGRARSLSEGDDIALFSTGICTEEAMRVVHVLKERGLSVRHLHVTTLKPFDDPQVLEACRTARHGVITMENHTRVGGLGACVAETIAENGLGVRQIRVALDDTYLQGASPKFLMKRYNIDAGALVRAVETLIGRDLAISEADISQARIDTYIDDKQQEAL
ncbi:transketolase C-terminal domain-containing protein [Nitratireductor sp. StC3]|uniref:transketolase family protein n=1 Tax=Nitratireductor sp. StC3 TaxID=2126741 RepID=UPI000D0DE689|nr:transketolase C-terminal domain-containing protein [Nitratireductor sp. StC3]PSM16797.1 transketolase [Nitratireductor sp. StC3]